MNETIFFLLLVLLSLLVSIIDIYFRGKKVWEGKDEYRGCYLLKTRITRRYILFRGDCPFDYYKIFDKNRDGVADYKQHLYAVGRMFQKYSEGVSDIDKQIYADALQQTKNNELKRVNNSQGERMYKVLLTTWSIAAVIIVVIISFLYITSLKGSIQGFKDRENENVKLIKSIEMGHDLAVKIMTRNYWYILNDEYISSEPDGCGEIIKLDQTLKPARSRMSVKNPEKNIKIYFFFKPWYVVRHYDEWYSMAFGFLWYIY